MVSEANLGPSGREDLIEQHVLGDPRLFRSQLRGNPTVLVAIVIRQNSVLLPLYLECIEAFDYPKASIYLCINDNDGSKEIDDVLTKWITRNKNSYLGVERNFVEISKTSSSHLPYVFNQSEKTKAAFIKNVGLRRALDKRCEFYFSCEFGNFVRPCSLRELVALNLPIVAPFLRSTLPGSYYSNYHANVDHNGYYSECKQYQWILNRWVRGVIELPLINGTYLARADILNELTYEDGTDRDDYVIFSESARKANVVQYLDNRQVYGYIAAETDTEAASGRAVQQARQQLGKELPTASRNLSSNPIAQDFHADKQLSALPVVPSRLRTLIFCTAFAHTREIWNGRYARWLRAIRASKLDFDSILMVDDGSPVLPDWPDLEIWTDAVPKSAMTAAPEFLLYHFRERLGREAVFDFPGWYRSFAFAGRYAYSHGFEKVIHIKSDSFIIGDRVQRYFNEALTGWTALWCGLYPMPESSLQIIAGDALRRFSEIEKTHPHASLVGREFELQLPFDVVEKQFKGSRYGEYLPFVPGNAEYAVSVKPDQPANYYWWIDDTLANQ